MLNGKILKPDEAVISTDDRGLLYGDGLFETMLLENGRVHFIDDHLQRLSDGCKRLHIQDPDVAKLRKELQLLTALHHDGVVKLIVTRGRGGRGYSAQADSQCTRLWQVFAPVTKEAHGLTVRFCAMQLGRNVSLAGMKHLNRLEQVLARSEWNDEKIAEGLLLDTEGELICGTMSNVFLVVEGTMVTPDLRYCGVQGIMRKNVLTIADKLKIGVEVRAVRPEELYSASEVFITNVLRGVRPVACLLPWQSEDLQRNGHRWTNSEFAVQIKLQLDELYGY